MLKDEFDILPRKGSSVLPYVLEATRGPLKGLVFTLENGSTEIGREPTNAIAILDSSVSRRHCCIVAEGDSFSIRDLESRNQTVVNGTAVRESALKPGDEIQIGSSHFLFSLRSKSDSATSEEHSPFRDSSNSPTVILRKEDALYLKPEAAQAELPVTPRTVRDLNALLRISAASTSVRGLEPLQQQILESVLEVIPAARAAILLCSPESTEIISTFGWDRTSGENDAVQVSRTVLQRVLNDGVAVLSNDVYESGDQLAGAESVVLRRIQSVLAVPVERLEQLLGVIYLDTSDPAVRFEEADLQLLTAVGSIAAAALENGRQIEWLERENEALQQQIGHEHNIVGDSPRLREVFQAVKRAAPTSATVLICGESGTGKERIARAIHDGSLRAKQPFIAINCAALPETLLESELFGHEKGAFTGAVAQKKGKLELAEGGTLFLDEIGEMTPLLQAKMLRFLQEREFERLGGTKTIKMDVRILAATNRDLAEESRHNRFRQDLYFRLNVVSVRMPPLRDRREDIPALASYFAKKFADRTTRVVRGISPEARACLVQYDWPGNVRELENAIERAVVMGTTEMILPEDLPEDLLERAPLAEAGALPAFHDGVREAKKRLIVSALDQADGNITEAGRLLGLHPNYLHRLMKNLNLKAAPAKR